MTQPRPSWQATLESVERQIRASQWRAVQASGAASCKLSEVPRDAGLEDLKMPRRHDHDLAEDRAAPGLHAGRRAVARQDEIYLQRKVT